MCLKETKTDRADFHFSFKSDWKFPELSLHYKFYSRKQMWTFKVFLILIFSLFIFWHFNDLTTDQKSGSAAIKREFAEMFLRACQQPQTLNTHDLPFYYLFNSKSFDFHIKKIKNLLDADTHYMQLSFLYLFD